MHPIIKSYRFFAIAIVLFLASCKTVLEINVENDLSGMGFVLIDEYSLIRTSKGLDSGDETRSYTLNVSQKDAQLIAEQIKKNEHFDRSYYEDEDRINTSKNTPKEIAYIGKNGYVLYLVESSTFHAKLYIDTANNILHYQYLSNLY